MASSQPCCLLFHCSFQRSPGLCKTTDGMVRIHPDHSKSSRGMSTMLHVCTIRSVKAVHDRPFPQRPQFPLSQLSLGFPTGPGPSNPDLRTELDPLPPRQPPVPFTPHCPVQPPDSAPASQIHFALKIKTQWVGLPSQQLETLKSMFMTTRLDTIDMKPYRLRACSTSQPLSFINILHLSVA